MLMLMLVVGDLSHMPDRYWEEVPGIEEGAFALSRGESLRAAKTHVEGRILTGGRSQDSDPELRPVLRPAAWCC